MDLGEPGNDRTDAIANAKKHGKAEVVSLLERFKENAAETRHTVRVDLGLVDEVAAEMFALVIFVSDGLVRVKKLVGERSHALVFWYWVTNRVLASILTSTPP